MCVVTSELIGLFKNGGIGTSMTGLAETLAKAGFPVTVLYTGGYTTPEAELMRWRARYAEIGIRLEWLCFEDADGLAGATTEAGVVTPWLVWSYLRERSFDIVQFNDCIGEGALALSMKRLGAAFAESTMCVALHSPSQWVFEAEHILPKIRLQAAFNYNERLSTQCADVLWSPSRYLLDWIRMNGFTTPEGATFVQPYAIPSADLFGAAPPLPQAPIAPFKPREIAFFGRLEERKGLRLFCETIGQMHGALAAASVSVVFLGKSGTIGILDSTAYIAAHARGWRCDWRIETRLGQHEAIGWLRDRQGLAVIASPIDNSPCTVYEALAFGIPFVATRCGGIPEIIAVEDHDRVLFEHDVASLAEVIGRALRDGTAPARPAQSQEAIRATWASAFAALPTVARLAPPTPQAPRSIHVIVDHVDGACLDATLASLDAIPGGVRITIVDRSIEDRVASTTNTVITESSSAVLRSVLDAAADATIMLLRSGVTVEPEGFAALLEALRHTEVDGLLPAAYYTGAGRPCIIPPLGGSAAFAFFEGVAITGGLVLKGDRLAELARAHEPIPECEFFGLADAAVVHGLALWPFAIPVWRVAMVRNMDDTALAAARRIAAYGAVDPVERYYINAIGYGATIVETPVSGRLMLEVLIRRLRGMMPGRMRMIVQRIFRR